MADDTSGFTPQQSARLADIWDRLYSLYLARANGDAGPQVETEIETLIAERNSIRAWGWNTGQNWKDDIPADELAKLMGEK